MLRWILVGLAVLAFWPFVKAPLFWDDLIVITPDGPIASLSTIGRALTGRCVLFPPHITYDYYRPCIDILFVLEYAIAGGHPFVYHLTNFLLHMGNILLAFEIYRRISGDSRSVLAAFLGAGFFGLHPVQVESALWPAARPAVLATFFVQLGMLAFVAIHARRDRALWRLAPWLALGVAGFALGMFSKESALVFIAGMIPLACLYRHPGARPLLVGYGLLWVFLLVYLGVNGRAGSRAAGMLSGQFTDKIVLMLQGLGFYLQKLLAPVSLYPSYGQVIYRTPANLGIGALLAVTGAALVGVACWSRRIRLVWAAAGLGVFFAGACVPFAGGVIDVADRYLYHSMWGLGLALGVLLSYIHVNRTLLFRIGLAVLVVASLASLRQSWRYTDPLGMWMHVHRIDPANPMGMFHVAKNHERLGNTGKALEFYLKTVAIPSAEPLKEQTRAAYLAQRLYIHDREYRAAADLYEIACLDDAYGGESRVWTAMALYSLGEVDRAHELYSEFTDDGRREAEVYANLARIALFFEHDPDAARLWYAKAREHGLAVDATFEGL